MNTKLTGELIRRLREEQSLTQRELADQLGVSDKAVSKWECGGGCPDVSLLPELAKQLGTPVETLLQGTLSPDCRQGGTMKRTAFRVCSTCGNIITTTGDAEVSCCGRKLDPLKACDADEHHALQIESVEGDFYITFNHPMTKDHFIGFIAAVGYDRIALEKLYPEQGSEARIPRVAGAVIYTYCNQHGLMKHNRQV